MNLKTERPLYVLDSSAVIALVRRERGWENVQAALPHSLISAVNLGETMTCLIRKGGEPRLVQRYLRGLALETLPWDEELAWESRDLCPLAWTHGFSFADRACLTLARHLRLAAMTGDTLWARVNISIEILLFRDAPV